MARSNGTQMTLIEQMNAEIFLSSFVNGTQMTRIKQMHAEIFFYHSSYNSPQMTLIGADGTQIFKWHADDAD